MSIQTRLCVAALAGCLAVLTGCQTVHYRITDTSTGRHYYAVSDTVEQGGTVLKFTDAQTGDPRTIHQTFRLSIIPSESYHAAVGQDAPGQEVASAPAED